MNTDKALANSIVSWIIGGGDAGRGMVERISFLLGLMFTHPKCKK
jgi:hypothetical protein